MFAISDRVRPCSARSSPRSVGRVTVMTPSDCSIFIRAGTSWVSSPSGPLTMTRPGESDTLTLAGSSMGCFPILGISLPVEALDVAADSVLFDGARGDEPVRRRHERGAHPAERAQRAVVLRVVS